MSGSDGQQPRIFAAAAELYLSGGFYPLPVQGKSGNLPRGATGRNGVITAADVAVWKRSRPFDNVAIRHVGTMAIDVDHYGEKTGAHTLERLEAALGTLPTTVYSTARGGGSQSRQLVFRVSEGLRFSASLEFIDIIQESHRYSVVWPSIHPVTGTTYRWYSADGAPLAAVPRMTDIAELPQEWVSFLTTADVARRASRPISNPVSLEDLLRTTPGEGERNNWLTRVAGHLAVLHRDDEGSYLRRIHDANRQMTHPLRADEVAATARSIWSAEHRSHQNEVLLEDSPLAEWVGDKLRDVYCWSGGLGWMRFSAGAWRVATEPAVIEAVRELFREQHLAEFKGGARTERLKRLAVLLSNSKIRAVTGLLRGILEVDAARFDTHPDLLNCRNGVVDLRTSTLLPHRADLLLTKITNVDFLPGAKSSDWSKALEALPPDVVWWLQVRFGQAATGHMTPDDLLVILQGGGANGKSTVVAAVMSALGGHAATVPERVLMANPSDHPTELTTLKGVRFALIEETPEARRLSVKRLKDLIGTPTMTARRIRENNMTWESTHSLFLTTNYRPTVAETDHGTWRRLALVQFGVTYRAPGEELAGPNDRRSDPGLRERLRMGQNGQREAVLAWLVAGAREWYGAKMQMPPTPATVVDQTRAWRADSDLVLAYIQDRLMFDPQSCVLSLELFDDFSNWLTEHGHHAWADQTFLSRFESHEEVLKKAVSKARTTSPKGLSRRDPKASPSPTGKQRIWQGVKFQPFAAEQETPRSLDY